MTEQTLEHRSLQHRSLQLLRAIARTPVSSLETAIDAGDVARVWFALESGAIMNSDMFLRAFGKTEIVRIGLERGVDPAADDNLALRFASKNGYTEIVRLLIELPLDRGVDPAIYNNLSIRMASHNGHTEVVRILLDLPAERGVNPTVNNNVVIRDACVNGHTEIVRLLLDVLLERGSILQQLTLQHFGMCVQTDTRKSSVYYLNYRWKEV
jgi:ankyrin repeat protein